MYEYFEGIISEVTPSYVVVDVNGIGYKVFSPTPFAYKQGQKPRYISNKLFVILALLYMDFKIKMIKDYFLNCLV